MTSATRTGAGGAALRLDLERVRRDVEALAAMERGSAAREKPQVPWLEQRLRDAGAHQIRVEPFRFQRRWAWRQGAPAGVGIAAAALGGPAGAALAAGALASFELDVSGKSRWTSRLLPGGEGANVAARVPAGGAAARTLVLVAHHDASRTGWLWRSPLLRFAFRNARERGGPRPVSEGLHVALALVAVGALVGSRLLRVVGAALLAAAAAIGIDVARSPLVPGANDNATGVAAALALVAALARDPLERTDVVVVFPDCEEVGMGGMAAWLAAHRGELDPAATLVVGLDSLGSGAPVVSTRESPLLGRYRGEDLDWADRGALRVGEPPPRRTSLTLPTDAIVARQAGLRAISILSNDRDGGISNYHLPSDTADNVDWQSVERCTRLAGGVARVWDAVS